MNTTTENAIRCAAKDCLKEITTLTKGKPVSQHDSIITPLLDKYTARITALPVDKFTHKAWLGHFIRKVRSKK